ncbi:MAG: hypothetical protein R2771_02395 [Saprospiraceae bacterium]
MLFSQDNVTEACSFAKYMSDYEKAIGTPQEVEEFAKLQSQLTNILGLHELPAPDLNLYNKLFGLENLTELQDNVKFKEMIIKFREMKKLNNNFNDFEKLVEILIDGMDEPHKTKFMNQLNGQYGDEIMDEIVDAYNDSSLSNSQKVARTKKKAKNYRRLVESVDDLCN